MPVKCPKPTEKATWEELRKKYRISMRTPPKEVIEKLEEIGWNFGKTWPDQLFFGPTSGVSDELAEKSAQMAAALLMLKGHHMVTGIALNNLIQLVYSFAFMNRNILFVGEAGTGKELFADFYQGFSMRKKQAINCAGISENAAISKLFGHVKGAYSGANEDRDGLFATAKNKKEVIFLDELGAASKDFQAQLLRVLETGDYQPFGSDEVKHIGNIPVCAATSDSVAVRQDLRDRFIILYIPPLREHSDDIPAICKGEWETWEDEFEKPDYISRKALELLKSHSWPDNVRGLIKTLQIAADLTNMDGSDTIRLEHLPTLCDCKADRSRKLKISKLKSKDSALPLPREAFFRPFRSLNQNDKFSISPDQYKDDFYQHFKNYKAIDLHRKFPDMALKTLQNNLKKAKSAAKSAIS